VRVSEQHQVAVCVPYKAGSETWRYLLRTLNNVSDHETSGDSVRSWDQIRDYHHVIQVREPYERLLSAYRFTFQNSKGLRGNNNLNSVLLETYKSLSTDVSSNIVSFPQFLQSIVSGHRDLSRDQ